MISEQELLEKASARGRRNYKANCRKKQPSGLVNGQRSCEVSGFSIGVVKVSQGGCGPRRVGAACRGAAGGRPGQDGEFLQSVQNCRHKIGGLRGFRQRDEGGEGGDHLLLDRKAGAFPAAFCGGGEHGRKG